MMNNSFLVIGMGEVGLSMLQALYDYRSSKHVDMEIAALVQPGATHIRNLEGEIVFEQTILEPIDLVGSSMEELAAVFRRYHTVICCSGFSIGKGMQVKITEAVLRGGVKRYVPWQFGADYDKIGRGSAQPVFDEQLDVRDLLRSQSATEWVIVSTGMITSFLFREDFGVVSLENHTVRALGSWQNALTLTCCEDIGKMTVEVLFHKPRIVNDVVYISGETATFEQIAEQLEGIFERPFDRILLTDEDLKKSLSTEPDNIFHKYRLVFTDPGVSWPKEQTFNHQQKLSTIGITEWAKTNIKIV